MANISTWSTTAASNNANPPDGAPEGMAPSAVNNTMRESMAAVRTWYEDAEWTDFGYTHTYVAATQFKIAGTDYTGEYHVGRRVRVVAATPGTIYGTITATSFSTDTTVTVAFDSGSLSNEALTVSLAALSSNNASSVPGVEMSGDDWTHQGDVTVEGDLSVDGSVVQAQGSDVASAASLSLGAGNLFDITGTTSITSIVSKGVGTVVTLQFDGALTLTHHATDLVLPGGANITTAAGDIAVFYEYASGDWRCLSYLRADGSTVAAGWEKISSTTFSSTAEYEVTLSATYRQYHIIFEMVDPSGTTVELDATVSDGSYKSSGYWYGLIEQAGGTLTGLSSASSSSIRLTDTQISGAAGEEIFGEVWVEGHQNASGQAQVRSMIGHEGGGTVYQWQGHGRYGTDGAISAIKFAFSSGNFASGTATVYGLRA